MSHYIEKFKSGIIRDLVSNFQRLSSNFLDKPCSYLKKQKNEIFVEKWSILCISSSDYDLREHKT